MFLNIMLKHGQGTLHGQSIRSVACFWLIFFPPSPGALNVISLAHSVEILIFNLLEAMSLFCVQEVYDDGLGVSWGFLFTLKKQLLSSYIFTIIF